MDALFVSLDNSAASNVVAQGTFDWKLISPKPYLDYTPCWETFQCARLELPMDPFNSTTQAKVIVAIIRQPASVAITDRRYGGAILVNPGGPGGSGVDFLRGFGPVMKNIVSSDADGGKQYDLISFDPRGIGATRPRVQCFQSPALDHSWDVRSAEEGVFESSNAAFGRLWAMSIARGQSCMMSGADDHDVDFKRYVATSYVAADMLAIVEKHGEWREKEIARSRISKSLQSVDSELDQLRREAKREQLQYWGLSYGSMLGSTFAAMYPERVGRIVLDGVWDAEDYFRGLSQEALADTEKTMASFYYHCARSGYPACALANPLGHTTAVEVKARTQTIIQSLYHEPLPVVGPNPEVITYSDLKQHIFDSLYFPLSSFPQLAESLLQIESGNGTAFARRLLSGHAYDCKTPWDGLYAAVKTLDSTMAIMCSDADDQSQISKADFEQYLHNLTAISPTGASIWASVQLVCVHYNIRAAHRFTGPWDRRTSHPLLMIGTTADPVTPLRGAKRLAARFENAIALTQDSPGHSSFSAPSSCTAGYIQRYFQTGELPPNKTICGVDELPFGVQDNGITLASDVAFNLAAGGAQHATISKVFQSAVVHRLSLVEHATSKSEQEK